MNDGNLLYYFDNNMKEGARQGAMERAYRSGPPRPGGGVITDDSGRGQRIEVAAGAAWC
jgi:hypothetical protein